jgi:hypothetical protein
VRDILRFGPNCLRDDRNNVIALAETLAEHGWLSPLEAPRHDVKMWQIVRGPSR